MADGVKHDQGKTMWRYLPWKCLEYVVWIFMYGAKKYAPGNWKKIDDPLRYYDALQRHLKARSDGEYLDDESKMLHLGHMAWNAIALLWFELMKKLPRFFEPGDED